MRARRPFGSVVGLEISRFPRKERAHMPGSSTTPGRSAACADASDRVAFRPVDDVGARGNTLSRLDGWPMRSPVNASPPASRPDTHDSGPVWVATPSLQRTCTVYSLPVSRRTNCSISTTVAFRFGVCDLLLGVRRRFGRALMSVAVWSGSLLAWERELSALKERIWPVFGRSELRETAGVFL